MSSSDEIRDFIDECKARIASYPNTELADAAAQFMNASTNPKYSYNFSFLGRPIIQYPQDMVAIQELIWRVKPDLIIETGIAHGGSLIMSASMLALIEYCDAIEKPETLDPRNPKRKVLGIDIDIRPHNREAIESHPMSNHIEMIEGSSVDESIVDRVKLFAENYDTIMVCLDSNHTHDHVLAELEYYAQLTTPGSYCVVFDTIIEQLPEEMYPDRTWGPGNNALTAVREFVQNNDQFEIDTEIDNKLLISVAPSGYLKRVK